MNRTKKLLVSAVLATALSGIGFTSAAHAAPQPAGPNGQSTESTSTGPQAKSPLEVGKVDAKAEKALGPTNRVKVDEKTRAPAQLSIAADASVNFSTFSNYCSNQLIYPTVYNSSSVTKYIQVEVYANGSYKTFYTSVAANSYGYPYFYGVSGAYSAYLYVWNGSSYAYDEYKAGNNTCNVAETAACSSVYPGWVAVTIKNNGTAYASQLTQKLQPTPQASYYDYPVAGGAALTRWVYSGGKNYAIASHTLGSSLAPSFFAGYC